ncbi:hypothetical protein SEMRO_547_G164200.1 [Seminavis robusta]|uniref:Uncharacterized protein n=1 Tax=Seminavis robusta TaxID=568900 RepID=A0A9N8E2D2_9STRA|nr:hypothetical protein SEMRO_547_G164200.1 [Seminavis robusta]|eukprot:Sro547_g164200.1 n/a (255) ;mRNA; f:24258-25116
MSEQPPPLKKVRGKEPTGKTAIDDDSSEDEENAEDTSAEESDEDDSEDEEDTAKKPKGKKGVTIAFPCGRGSGRGGGRGRGRGRGRGSGRGTGRGNGRGKKNGNSKAKANQDDIKAEGEAKKRDAKYDKLDDYCLSRAVANVTCNLKKGAKEKGKVLAEHRRQIRKYVGGAHVGFAKFLKDMGRIDEANNVMNRAMNAQMKPYSEYENLGKLDQAEAKADDEGAADEDDVDTLPPLGGSGSDTNGTDTVTGTDV